MVNNINGLTSTQSNANRSRERPQPPEANTANRDAAAKPGGEQVELSPEAKKLQDIESNLSQLPDVDQNRVSAIKDALRDGSYSVDPARLAAKIARFELNI
jgi:negative regulator of flagellin synthesis FlgM